MLVLGSCTTFATMYLRYSEFLSCHHGPQNATIPVLIHFIVDLSFKRFRRDLSSVFIIMSQLSFFAGGDEMSRMQRQVTN